MHTTTRLKKQRRLYISYERVRILYILHGGMVYIIYNTFFVIFMF